MATLIFSAVGSAVGSAIGGSVLGVSAAVIGRAVGATVGQAIDRAWFAPKVLGSGSDVVEQGRLDRLRLTGASEGAGIEDVHGRVRLGGQVIWATRFLERVSDEVIESGASGGGKGGGGGGETQSTTVRSYSYSVSVAIAIAEGKIAHLGRIWADGALVSKKTLNLRVYKGGETQLPDPKIEAVQGAGRAPAYRGIAYVVIEDLELAPFGNRIPQFSFEVIRPEPAPANPETDLTRLVRGVALVPGSGEYALATEPVYLDKGKGRMVAANVNSPAGKPDIRASVRALRDQAPNCRATSLVVSWFGDDLRCGQCRIRPKVEQKSADGREMPWSVSGLTRWTADTVPYENGRPIYGGTPSDDSVKQAISYLRENGRSVLFYPFILMEQLPGNGRPDPWSNAAEQRRLPWRGRITLDIAPGRTGSTDGTGAAEADVAAFFGTARPQDFALVNGRRIYQGPAEDSYRRFILHNAWLCADAGGVDAFCIGSEMRSLTQIRGAGNSFPAVAALRTLAADVRTILGPGTKISYAADWSEYFGYRPDDGSGDVFFHLDPLWADPEIDFIGIDNYMPVADWRDGDDHADAGAGSIYDLDYLRGNIAGGEGFDWYYGDAAGRAAQTRLPIRDTAHGEDWVFRTKDLVSWWSNPHHDRPGGVRRSNPTPWVPQSKPFWFTELGCAAIDKGANAPNLFYDPKSSESAVPPHSTGRRDDYMQNRFLTAHLTHWADPANNPVSTVTGQPMVDLDRIFLWCWDARPYPSFPNRKSLWSDGANHARGHWLNGRLSSRTLASVVAEICARSGVTDIDLSELHGIVRGFQPGAGATGRAALQPLMLAYGFDAIERDGRLQFRTRTGRATADVGDADLVVSDEVPAGLERVREPATETVGRVQITSVDAGGSFRIRTGEAVFPGQANPTSAGMDLPLMLTRSERQTIADRWLTETRAARDGVRFALPPSRSDLGAGDIARIDEPGGDAFYRIDQVEAGGLRLAEARRIEPSAYLAGPAPLLAEDDEEGEVFAEVAPVLPVFLDLPLLTGAEVPHAPHLAVFADPWPGAASVYRAAGADGFRLSGSVARAATLGETLTPLLAARPDHFDRGPALRVELYGGALASVGAADLLNGANVAAIGSGQDDHWEVFQFQDAALVAPNTYDLTLRLRGQAGTDPLIPPLWPVGSRFVLLTSALRQPDLVLAERGLERTWRVGPATAPVTDTAYREERRAFAGIGLRPYAPAHLRAWPDGAGGHEISWVRRTRIEGDSWEGYEVPLGEARELYLVRVRAPEGALLREETVEMPHFIYNAADRAADGAIGAYRIEIAQISDRFGPGLFRGHDVND